MADRTLDRGRIDVEDPIAESGLGAGGAVVQLVRMQHMRVAGEAMAARAAIADRLHAGRGDADRVGVVPMRRERPSGERGFQALDAGCAAARMQARRQRLRLTTLAAQP